MSSTAHSQNQFYVAKKYLVKFIVRGVIGIDRFVFYLAFRLSLALRLRLTVNRIDKQKKQVVTNCDLTYYTNNSCSRICEQLVHLIFLLTESPSNSIDLFMLLKINETQIQSNLVIPEFPLGHLII
ncbi:hypothetical protein BpHYR1_022268 [Brachionus plicatilis]|uniref:Uncharacterized protein n=1 Tax=Brachionus plicatilis TaxID=10195 RepID=A0A3M7REL0_BRAPC|nr:hypothetical protein BpHYR1_022268 [Brachionus plicatilis]